MLFAILLCSGHFVGDAQQDFAQPASKFTAQEIKAVLGAACEKLDSIYVAYRSDSYEETAGFPEGTYVYRIVAAKAPCYFYHRNTHGHVRLNWSLDPLQRETFVTDTMVVSFNPVNRTYFEASISPEAPLPGTLRDEFLLSVTALWPLHSRPPPRYKWGPIVLREIVNSKAYNFVRPLQEKVRGRWCHVLEEPNLDAIWIDMQQRGCCILARESYDFQSKQQLQRIDFCDHEWLNHFWFPKRIEVAAYQGKKGWNRSKVEIVEVHVNDVQNGLFEFVPPKGALRYRSDAPPLQAELGGVDHLESLGTWIENQYPTEAKRPSRMRYSRIIVIGLLIAIALLLLTRRTIAAERRSEVETQYRESRDMSSKAR